MKIFSNTVISRAIACSIFVSIPGIISLANGDEPDRVEGEQKGNNDHKVRNIKVPKQPMSTVDPGQQGDETDIGRHGGQSSWLPENVILLPIPSREPIFGWGIEVLGGVFLDLDKEHEDTPPSSVGVMGSYSENGTWSGGLVGSFNLYGDDIRIEAAAFYADANYRFWGIGGDAGSNDQYANVNQKIPIFYANIKYQIFHKGYFGAGYLRGKSDTSIKLNGLDLPPGFDTFDESLDLGAIELPFQYDTRDNQQYPRTGWLVDANGVFYREIVGSDFNTESYSLSGNHYLTVRDRDVLAFRGWTTYTGENAPFYLQASVGGRSDMRGYEWGRYIDRVAYAVQSEYRWQLNDTWILTGFAGVAEVAPSYGEVFKELLPAAGVGGRYVLSREYNVTLAVDVAVGRNGAVYYFTVGEAF